MQSKARLAQRGELAYLLCGGWSAACRSGLSWTSCPNLRWFSASPRLCVGYPKNGQKAPKSTKNVRVLLRNGAKCAVFRANRRRSVFLCGRSVVSDKGQVIRRRPAWGREVSSFQCEVRVPAGGRADGYQWTVGGQAQGDRLPILPARRAG